MGSKFRILLFHFAVYFLILGNSLGLKLQIYEQKHYQGLQGEYKLKGEEEKKCVNFRIGGIIIRSVRTDKCVILYETSDCVTPSNVSVFSIRIKFEWSHRFDKDTEYFEYPSTTHPYYHMYRSFHVCSQALGGGPRLDLDIYDSPSTGNRIQEYRDVCFCRNVPVYISRNHNMYIVAHGNGVQIFSEENCWGKSYQLSPADNVHNRFPYTLGKFEMRSFKPIGLKNCYSLYAEIYRFHFRNGTDDPNNLPTKNIKLGIDSVIYNNGTSEDSQTYTLESKVTSSLEFSVTKSVQQTLGAGVKTSVEITAEIGVPLIANTEIQTQIAANYQWSMGDGSETANTTTVTKEEAISISQEMKIPGCNRCVISSMVQKVEGFPIKYDLYFLLGAADDDKDPTAEEVRKNLPPGMKYIRNYDNHIVEASTDGVMYVEFGLRVITTKDCAPIPGCGPSSYAPSSPSHTEYIFPLTGAKLKKLGRSRMTFLSFLQNTFGILLKQN